MKIFFSFIPKYFARIFEMNTKSPTQMNFN